MQECCKEEQKEQSAASARPHMHHSRMAQIAAHAADFRASSAVYNQDAAAQLLPAMPAG
jgi:hypothetical protein